MPTYRFRDTISNMEIEMDLRISEYDEFLINNPTYEALITGVPMLHSGRGLGGGLKIDDGFNDVLKEIKTKHSGGYKLGVSTIETK